MTTNIVKTTLLVVAFTMIAALLVADCKLMALMGLNDKNLGNVTGSNVTMAWSHFTDPCLLKLRSLGNTNNPDGWGLITYDGSSMIVGRDWRGDGQASTDSYYNTAMGNMMTYPPRIILGHVRKSTNVSGFDDPHPFRFIFGGREYSFIHNGTVDSVDVKELIDDLDNNWLIDHPLTYHNGSIVDSEAYFSWIMLNITRENGNVLQALKKAVSAVYTHAQESSYDDINFVLSDGLGLYAYRNTDDDTHPLSYYYETDEVNQGVNSLYCGVMTLFPDADFNDVDNTHLMDNNELVYISSTGNIVRLPNFGVDTIAGGNIAEYAQKIGFHEGVNWTGFPILDTTETISDLFEDFTNPTNGGLTLIDAKGENDVTYGTTGWSDATYQLNQTSLYKLSFVNDSPSIHTLVSTEYPINSATLIESNILLINEVIANQEYWLSYTLLPSQNIREAFGSSWANVKSVKAEKWYYQYPPVDPKGGTNEAVPLYTFTTNGKNMDFGKGYIVTFKSNQSSFTWNRSYEPVLPSPGKEKAVNFTWVDKPDYVVVDVVEAENQTDILEIGAYQGTDCVGAVKTDTLPCQILIYPDYENPTPVTFQIIYDTKAQPKDLYSYQVYDHNSYAYCNDQIIPVKDGLYQVKLTGSETGSGLVIGKTLKTLSNYPNPFNPETNISFALNTEAILDMAIYNVKGQLVKSLASESYQAGNHRINWNGKDNDNNALGSGLYFIRINSGKESITHKMIMLK